MKQGRVSAKFMHWWDVTWYSLVMKQRLFGPRKTSHYLQIWEEGRFGERGLQNSWELWRSVERFIGFCSGYTLFQTPQSNVLYCLTENWEWDPQFCTWLLSITCTAKPCLSPQGLRLNGFNILYALAQFLILTAWLSFWVEVIYNLLS